MRTPLSAVLVVLLGLLAFAPPAKAAENAAPVAARRAATTIIKGFPTRPTTVPAGKRMVFRVRVKDRTTHRRTVRLQQKVHGRWRTKKVTRANRRGRAKLVWRAKRSGRKMMRVAVTAARGARPARSAPRRIVVTSRPGATRRTKADGLEAAVLTLLNRARGQARTCGSKRYPAVGPLRRNAKLDRAARKFAQKMGDQKFFSHTSPNGDSPTDRAWAEGFRRGVGENIAAGYATAASVMEGWLKSPGHCANLMHPGYDVVGIGYAAPRPGRDAPYSSYWVQDFA